MTTVLPLSGFAEVVPAAGGVVRAVVAGAVSAAGPLGAVTGFAARGAGSASRAGPAAVVPPPHAAALRPQATRTVASALLVTLIPLEGVVNHPTYVARNVT